MRIMGDSSGNNRVIQKVVLEHISLATSLTIIVKHNHLGHLYSPKQHLAGIQLLGGRGAVGTMDGNSKWAGREWWEECLHEYEYQGWI